MGRQCTYAGECSVVVSGICSASEMRQAFRDIFPAGTPCVYEIWHDGAPQYVGLSTDVCQRLSSHISRDRLGNRFTTRKPWVFKVEAFGSYEDARQEEDERIKSGRFPLNGNHDNRVPGEMESDVVRVREFLRMVERIGFDRCFTILSNLMIDRLCVGVDVEMWCGGSLNRIPADGGRDA